MGNKKAKRNSKIKNHIKKYLYNFIMHHPQVEQSPIFNDGIELNIDGHTIPIYPPKTVTAGVRLRNS